MKKAKYKILAVLFGISLPVCFCLCQPAPSAHLMVEKGITNGEVEGLALSPDGSYAITTEFQANRACLWDTQRAIQLRCFVQDYNSASEVMAPAFSADDHWLMWYDRDGSLFLWDYRHSEEPRVVHGFRSKPKLEAWAAFSPDGKHIVTVDPGGDPTDVVPVPADIPQSVPPKDPAVVRILNPADGAVTLEYETKELIERKGFLNDGSGFLFMVGGRSLVAPMTESHVRDANAADRLPNAARSHDGRYEVRAVKEGSVELWDLKTDQLKWKVDFPEPDKAGFQHGDSLALEFLTTTTGPLSITRAVWDRELLESTFSPDGRQVLLEAQYVAILVDMNSGKILLSMPSYTRGSIRTISADASTLAILGDRWNSDVQIWRLNIAKQGMTLSGKTVLVDSLKLDGHSLMLKSSESEEAKKEYLDWDLDQGRASVVVDEDMVAAQRKIEVGAYAGAVSTLSADKQLAVEIDVKGHVRLLDASKGKKKAEFQSGLESPDYALISPDSSLLYISAGSQIETWDLRNDLPSKVSDFKGKSQIMFPILSSDRKTILISMRDTTELWDARLTRKLMSYNIPPGPPYAQFSGQFATFSPDESRVCASQPDKRNVGLWETASGKLIRLIGPTGRVAFDNGHPLVLQMDALISDGEKVDKRDVYEGMNELPFRTFSDDCRFFFAVEDDGTTTIWDTDTRKRLLSLVEVRGGGWIAVDSQGRFDTDRLDYALPLHWHVDGDLLNPLPLEVFMRDYYTPGLLARVLKGEKLPPVRSIAEIKNRVQPEVNLVSVVPSRKMTGCVDVTVHAASATDAKGTKSGLQDLRLFRDGQMVADGYREGALKDGDFVFRDVMLKSDAKKVTFTAYAFNSERIKSATASFDYEVKTPVNTAVKRKAFLLQVGVNHTSASGCELKYSVNDAETMSSALSEKLRSQGFEVEAVKLESSATAGSTADPSAAPQDDKFIRGASKESIRAQLKEIAAQATPDDVFFMSFSGHGYSAVGGAFYILPSSLQGDCAHVDDALLKSAISADELADWLRPIDAGEMTLILDACYSAESVQAGDFKPGPMGSRGLGQLAYDKRMRVLAASQSDAVAHEYDYLHQGLLSYVLVKDGLDKNDADWKPKDGQITVGEWLSYAATAVPQFKPSAPKGENKGLTVETTVTGPKAAGQVPALFDFSRTDSLVLAK